MQKSIMKFDNLSTRIINLYWDKLGNKGIPQYIYHYTDFKGLQGIMENGTLLFTDIFNLNDEVELRHGSALAIKRLIESRRVSIHFWRNWVTPAALMFFFAIA